MERCGALWAIATSWWITCRRPTRHISKLCIIYRIQRYALNTVAIDSCCQLRCNLDILVNTQDPKLWYGIGILYDRYGSIEHAEEAFSAVMKMDPGFEKANEIYFRLGIIYKQQQKYDLSLQVCISSPNKLPPSLTALKLKHKNFFSASVTFFIIPRGLWLKLTYGSKPAMSTSNKRR